MGHQGRGGAATRTRLDAATARTISTTLHALATPSRLLILATLRDGPATVQNLTHVVGMTQPAVSHQLRILRDRGLVEGSRDGRHVVYRLFDEHVAELIDQAIYHGEHVRMGATDRP